MLGKKYRFLIKLDLNRCVLFCRMDFYFFFLSNKKKFVDYEQRTQEKVNRHTSTRSLIHELYPNNEFQSAIYVECFGFRFILFLLFSFSFYTACRSRRWFSFECCCRRFAWTCICISRNKWHVTIIFIFYFELCEVAG